MNDTATMARPEATEVPSVQDDIDRIERRMNDRRAAIREHLSDARVGAEQTARRSWPVLAGGMIAGALAIGFALSQRPSRAERAARRLWTQAREVPDAARAYVHEATRPKSSAWTERVAAGTGIALAVMRTLPQVRALATAISRARARR